MMKKMIKKMHVLTVSEGMVRPCEPTPSGMLSLSVIDLQPACTVRVHTLHVFKHGPNAAAVIRAALSKALVHYYPLAGRLVESQVACTGEGVWFVEAVAHCNLESIKRLENDFMEDLRFELLPHPPPQSHGFDPLVLVQVTQFTCDGFVMGLVFSHTICDGLGASQFLKGVGEFARGLQFPTISPEWCREGALLASTAAARRLADAPPPPPPPPPHNGEPLEQVNIDVSPESIARLKREFLEVTGQICSTFEALAASVWRCRAQAISSSHGRHKTTSTSDENAAAAAATLVFFANVRGLVVPALPQGFYGNCFFPVVLSFPMERLACATHMDTVKLIQEAKAMVPKHFSNWMASMSCYPTTTTNTSSSSTDDTDDRDHHQNDSDPFAPPLSYATLFISEWGRLGFGDVDYGWGPPSYLVPVNLQNLIPVCIIGCPPLPHKGVRLSTWCVHPAHLDTFRQLLINHLI